MLGGLSTLGFFENISLHIRVTGGVLLNCRQFCEFLYEGTNNRLSFELINREKLL